MFKNKGLGFKIMGGYGIIIVLILIVGLISFNSVENLIGQINVISTQLEIVKEVNNALINTGDTQAAAIRMVLYKEKQYLDRIDKEIENVRNNVSKASSLMKLEENKQNVTKIDRAVDEYYGDIKEWWEIQTEINKIGKRRADAGDFVMEEILNIQNIVQKKIDENIVGNVVDYKYVVLSKKINKIVLAFKEVYISAYRSLLASKKEDQERLTQVWIDDVKKTYRETHECISLVDDENIVSRLEAIKENLNKYEKELSNFLAKKEQHAISQSSQKKNAGNALASCNNVQQVVYSFIDKVKDEADKAQKSTKNILVSIILLSIIAGIIIGYFLTKGISNSINAVVKNLRNGSDQVASASQQVSSSSQDMAQGANEQASSLEEISSSLEEMASMTRQNTENANQAKGLSEDTMDSAKKGDETMNKMSGAINKIMSSANETAQIVKTIDEIAFQTNLLALNAAVEAARAGEAGKGFAVVAEEVRNLAQRSAEAAKTTSQLIEESVHNASQGVKITDDVAKILTEIVTKIDKVNQLNSEISLASNEQTQGIDQVNTAVAQLNTVTQQNAANSEESASASEELTAQANELNQMVSILKGIIDGTDGEQTGGMNFGIPETGYKRNISRTVNYANNNTSKPMAANQVIPFDDNDFKDF